MAARKWCGDWCVGGGCGGLRVATARRFISSKIDALRSPASTAQCDATAKKGHVNYDLSNVPVKVRAAPTTGSGCHVLYWHARDDAKNSSFFGGSARRRKRDTHPADAIVGTERVGRGLGKGGSLVGVGDSVVPCGGHDRGVKTMEIASSSRVFLMAVGHFSPPGSAKLPAFAT